MKKIWAVALFSALVLCAAALWFGALNQDEGWYLYAAQMVSEGKLPYRDFSYTQGPLMPVVYSAFSWIWKAWGLLGARVFTLLVGLSGVVFTLATVRREIAGREVRSFVMLAVFVLLGCNLYHLYYLAIPKTYALAGLFLSIGFFLLSLSESRRRYVVPAAVALAFSAGVRISLGAVLAAVGVSLLVRRRWMDAVLFAAGGAIALMLVYGPFLFDAASREGLIAAQSYHASRGGGDIAWALGSLSRLVRWYLPVFILLGMGFTARVSPFIRTIAFSFAAVFAVQMAAPFPYEDYQVPVMPLLAVYAAVKFAGSSVSLPLAPWRPSLLVLGITCACSFGSPLLEKWMTNGQDRFWTVKKEKSELAQLRDVAARIEAMDPGGKDLLTQDLYLAVETGRHVPQGLEMGPFAMLGDEQWRRLLDGAPCRIAALSGYSFAIEPPRCNERPVEQQMEYWNILKNRYRFVDREEMFGQNATTLIILERKPAE